MKMADMSSVRHAEYPVVAKSFENDADVGFHKVCWDEFEFSLITDKLMRFSGRFHYLHAC